jgi:undecaprenyl-diphosphatase
MRAILEIIKTIDREILLAVNHSGHACLDEVMVLISQRLTWIPLYLLLAVMMFKAGRKNFIYGLLAVAVLILLSDQTSVLIKNSVERYRPCHHAELKSKLNLPDGCGGLYGFPSSHAANTAAISVFLFLFFRQNRKIIGWVMTGYCLLVGFSRVYLGRHYVTDILSGWLLGAAIGLLLFFAFQKIISYGSQKS